MNGDWATVARPKGTAYGAADGWITVCAASAAPIPDDDTDIIDGWLATASARELDAVLRFLLA